MAKLNPVLITSITNDLEELQSISKEMLMHVDTYEVISWKYPNKFCKDVQIDAESDMSDEAQKYILLLELTIDRLYFIINLAIHILGSLPNLSNIFNFSTNIQPTNDVSLGILICIFWKRLQTLLFLYELPPHSTKSENAILQNTYTQTEIRSFSTCENCHMFMKMMKELINKTEESITTVQPSTAISKTRQIIERDISKMTQFSAMQQWIDAVSTDVQILVELSAKNSSENLLLQENLDKMKKQKENVSKKLSDIKSKCSNLEANIKSSETKICSLSITNSTLEFKYNELIKTVSSLEEMHKKDLSQIFELENHISKMKSENEKGIYEIKIEYLKKVETLTEQRDHWKRMHTTSQNYAEEVENKFNKLEAKYLELGGKYEEEIEKERTKYKDYKINTEENHKKFIKETVQLEQKLEIQKGQYEKKLQNMQEELETLKGQLQLSKEREISLVQCPDLNGPLVHLPTTQLDPISDMENQLKSNQFRMEILHNQNISLQRTIDKMRHLTSSHGINMDK